jgi:hypothetical protein
MSNGYTPSAERIAYESGLFWDDWDRGDEIEAALKIATPEDAAVLTEALEPIRKRQDAYWDERWIEKGFDQEALKRRIAAFSESCKTEKRPATAKLETR